MNGGGRHGRRDAGAVRVQTLSARSAARRVLSDLRGGRRTAHASIDRLLAGHDLPPRELALATELVMGVVRHRLTLAHVLGGLAVRGWHRVSWQLQDILMLGAYQVLWLDGVPAFAAVSEAVKQAKGVGGTRAGRFVNAVLRQLLRQVEHRRIEADRADPRRAIPIDSTTSCQLREAVLPDPSKELSAYLSAATSHPQWLVSRWLEAFGEEETRRVCIAGMLRPPVVLRPNRLRGDATELASCLRAEGYDGQVVPGVEAVALPAGSAVTRSEAFARGRFQPQDETAMEAVRQMRLSPGDVVLDLCAGVGTKSTQIAEVMGDKGLVLACDKDTAKLDLLQANCSRLGVATVRTVGLAELESAVAGLPRLDWILIDVPCSNTGVLGRRPEARYRLNGPTLDRLSGVQEGLLAQAARLADGRDPPARLMYCTCSIEGEENENVQAEFGREHPRWRLTGGKRTLPAWGASATDWRDGGYWASWRVGGG